MRLAIYDACSHELFRERIPGTVRYRLSRGGSVVQESGAISYLVGMADATRRSDYTLVALDRSGNALRSVRFTVAPRSTPQLAAALGSMTTPTNPSSPTPPLEDSDLPADVARRLERVFDIANGDALERVVALDRRLVDLYRHRGQFQACDESSRTCGLAVLHRCQRTAVATAVRSSQRGTWKD